MRLHWKFWKLIVLHPPVVRLWKGLEFSRTFSRLCMCAASIQKILSPRTSSDVRALFVERRQTSSLYRRKVNSRFWNMANMLNSLHLRERRELSRINGSRFVRQCQIWCYGECRRSEERFLCTPNFIHYTKTKWKNKIVNRPLSLDHIKLNFVSVCWTLTAVNHGSWKCIHFISRQWWQLRKSIIFTSLHAVEIQSRWVST